MIKAIFLDRDGVINKTINGKPPQTVKEVELVDGIKELVNYFIKNEFKIFCITNQPDVSRGTQTIENVEKINDYLWTLLPITDFAACYHSDQDNCICRKPKDGLIRNLSKQYDVDLSQSYVIGDRWRDIEAGQRANCRTIFIDYKYDEKQPINPDYTINKVKDVLSIFQKGKK